eukprot:Platyproteum_vivax@DN5404_c0_g1_i1.p1
MIERIQQETFQQIREEISELKDRMEQENRQIRKDMFQLSDRLSKFQYQWREDNRKIIEAVNENTQTIFKKMEKLLEKLSEQNTEPKACATCEAIHLITNSGKKSPSTTANHDKNTPSKTRKRFAHTAEPYSPQKSDNGSDEGEATQKQYHTSGKRIRSDEKAKALHFDVDSDIEIESGDEPPPKNIKANRLQTRKTKSLRKKTGK